MAKRQEKQERTPVNYSSGKSVEDILPVRYRLKCKNHIQKDFANLITEKEITVAAGPAGVGKSYVAVARAIELLQNKSNPYKKIIVTTAGEGVGKDHGFLPGTLREKMEPYMGPVIGIIDKIIGKQKRIELEEAEILELQPLTFIRGASIDNAILLMEEAQNTSPFELKTLLTRIGENTKFIISGDLDQSDRFKFVNQSGLYDIIHRHRNVEEIGFIEFEVKDIVRNPLISKILANYKIDVAEEPKKEVKPKAPQSNKKKRPIKYSRFRAWIRKNFKW